MRKRNLISRSRKRVAVIREFKDRAPKTCIHFYTWLFALKYPPRCLEVRIPAV